MLQYQGHSLMEYWKLRGIAKKVRAGIIPKDTSKEDVWEALRVTRPRNAAEIFGFLSAVVHNPDGSIKKDYGLVSCREVTAAFAKRLVDAMCTSGDVIDNFNQHKQGSGSTAETDTETALVAAQSGAQGVTGNAAATHGSSSQIYQTVGTITATTAYEIREHGVFNASTGGILLDRSVVTAIAVNTDDVVTWTYQLTVNAGG
jgi:hypothetical protein